ncbi:hypothetical protein MUK42_34018 [Musa troglodytarum]|uniref:VQ domain-containing protein n=1 Tax=Musa troglodytarum TaxID=320322 RepID=A0A9E7EDZ9_9LILI|nr:hypothetical protein MUK42_34018 [Musa troglodytarum]
MKNTGNGKENASPPPRPPPPYPVPLRIIRQPLAKPRVYHVHPRGFRQLVQSLTGAPRPHASEPATEASTTPSAPLMPAPPTLLSLPTSTANVMEDNSAELEFALPSPYTEAYTAWSSSPIWGTMADDDDHVYF